MHRALRCLDQQRPPAWGRQASYPCEGDGREPRYPGLQECTCGLDDWPIDVTDLTNHYDNQKPTSPPAARSAKTRSAFDTAYRRNKVEVNRTETEPDQDDLDVGYSLLASEFNSETANAERRAARDRYAGRTGEP